MNKRILSILVAGAALSLLGGCMGSTNNNSGNLPDPTVRFVNGSPATTGVDFYLNDALYSSRAYLGSSANFQDLEFIEQVDGGYDAAIRSTGGTLDLDRQAPDPPIFNRNTHNLMIAFGLPNPGGEILKRSQLMIMSIDRAAPVGNKSRLYIFNGMQRATGFENASMTLQTIEPGNPSSIDNPQFKRENVQYGDNTDNNPLQIDSGSLTWIARLGDVDAVNEFARTTFTFGAGKIYLALITGQEGAANPALQPRVEFIELETKN